AAELDRRLLLLDAKPLLDAMPRTTGTHVREPVPVGTCRRRRDYLDRVGVLQLARQRRHASVHARTVAMQSDFRVHGEREIDRGCALGKLDHVAGRREHEYLVLIEIEL